MVLAGLRTVVLGTFAFAVFWVLAVFPSFKLLPIGRTAGAVGGAVLTVVFQVLSPHEAYGAIDLSILGLLFGTMVVSAYLERADMFKYLAKALSWRSQGGKDLLCRVCILSAISSALFTNDTSCVVLTEFVLKLCRQKSLHPKPFLLALATSANIGSVATPIGNPQNLVIAVHSGISFGAFLLGLLPCMLLGVTVNTVLLLLVYWRQLSPMQDQQFQRGALGSDSDEKITVKISQSIDAVPAQCSANQTPPHEIAANVSDGQARSTPLAQELATGISHNNGPSVQSPPTPKCKPLEGEKATSSDATEIQQKSPGLQIVVVDEESQLRQEACGVVPSATTISPVSHVKGLVQSCAAFYELYGEEKASTLRQWKRRAWKCAVYVVTAAMLAALLYGLNLSWCALTAAVVMMALDFQDAAPNLEKVSYTLLVFFAGMFITVDGFNTTGIPGTFWEAVEPHARIGSASGVVVLALVVIVLSNVASNVPTVLLLGSRVSSSAALHGASVTRSWLILAWTSTVAGNLTLVGSAANLIVSEQAGKAQMLGYKLRFWNHLMFGLPSTLVVAAVGLFTIKG